HVFDSVGLRRPDMWYTWNPALATPQFVALNPGFIAANAGQSYCIDSRFVVRNADANNWQKAPYAAATFPYVSNNNSPAKLSLPMLVTMSRVAYFPISGPADFQNRYVTDAANTPYFWRNQLQADMIFQFDDDLS